MVHSDNSSQRAASGSEHGRARVYKGIRQDSQAENADVNHDIPITPVFVVITHELNSFSSASRRRRSPATTLPEAWSHTSN